MLGQDTRLIFKTALMITSKTNKETRAETTCVNKSLPRSRHQDGILRAKELLAAELAGAGWAGRWGPPRQACSLLKETGKEGGLVAASETPGFPKRAETHTASLAGRGAGGRQAPECGADGFQSTAFGLRSFYLPKEESERQFHGCGITPMPQNKGMAETKQNKQKTMALCGHSKSFSQRRVNDMVKSRIQMYLRRSLLSLCVCICEYV